MCGIAGIFDLRGRAVAEPDLVRMMDAIRHRGPDGRGSHIDGSLGLGHCRLAILDISPAGAQPMSTPDADLVITYNGEIYNFQSLRLKLQALGYRFQSQTDTEVLLYAWHAWGEQCVERFNGMFAFAAWLPRERQLFLARDRYGIKPLYYYHKDGLFLFGSEIKAILTHPDVSVRVSAHAMSEYFAFQNIFTDLTLFEDIRLLPPGSTLRIQTNAPPRQRKYWDFRFDHQGFNLSPQQTAEHLSGLFDRAVTRHLVSDVPVGSYLSGGLDSGSIVAVASRHIRRLRTFTGGFDLSSASGLELGFDERPAAEMIANQFKTEHYEMVMHAGDMEYVMPQLIWHLEDLRVGQSYPNFYVAQLASKFVKVVLSGAGGDELFAGYPWRYYRGISAAGGGSFLRGYYDYWQRLLPDEERAGFFRDDLRRQMSGHEPWDVFQGVFAGADLRMATVEDVVNASLYFEARTFLHGLFVVEDKLSMAHSLETRVPFMDNELVDFAMTIPPNLKLRELATAPRVDEDEPGKRVKYQSLRTADGKIVLREAMRSLIPDEIAARAKQGFSAPDASWFRGESVDYVNRLLRDPRARIADYLNPQRVATVLDQHASGAVNHRLLIWSMLSFEWWLRRFAP